MRHFALLVPLLCQAQTLAPPFDNPSNWLSYDRDNTARRYSPLDQIRPSNIKRLTAAWVMQFPVPAVVMHHIRQGWRCIGALGVGSVVVE